MVGLREVETASANKGGDELGQVLLTAYKN